MGKIAIITGGTGFVGSNLCRKLVEQQWRVYLITRPSSDYASIADIKNDVTIYEDDGDIESLIEFFKQTAAEVVFHLASVFVAEHGHEDIDRLVESNLKFGLHILEAMKASQTKLLINTGTSWQHYHNATYNPVDLYAATKEAFESLMRYYSTGEGLRVITLKLFDTYGETDKRPKLINLLNHYAETQQELQMSPGEQMIDLVHVEDVINAFIKAYEYLYSHEDITDLTFGVATGNPLSLKSVIKIFEALSGEKLKIQWGGRDYRKREVMTLWTDYERLPNWTCDITIEEGLKRYLSNVVD